MVLVFCFPRVKFSGETPGCDLLKYKTHENIARLVCRVRPEVCFHAYCSVELTLRILLQPPTMDQTAVMKLSKKIPFHTVM